MANDFPYFVEFELEFVQEGADDLTHSQLQVLCLLTV